MLLNIPNSERLNQISIKMNSRLNSEFEIEYIINKNDLKDSPFEGAEGIFVMPSEKIIRRNGKIVEHIKDKSKITEGIKLFKGTSDDLEAIENNKAELSVFLDIHGGEGGYVSINEGQFYAAAIMEKKEGPMFTEFFKNNPNLTDVEAAETILKVIKGLEKVHCKNYVHADAKPENIILGEEAYFIDFGTTRKQGVIREFPIGSQPAIPHEVNESKKRGNVIYDKKQDFYSLFCFILDKNPKINLLGIHQRNFEETHTAAFAPGANSFLSKLYILNFVKEHENSKDKTPVMKLLCSEPSKLNSNIITSIKMQLHNIILASKKPEELDAYFKEKNQIFNDAINNEKNEEIQSNSRTLRNQYFDEFSTATEPRKIEIIRSVILATIILENPNKSDDYLQSQTQKLSEHINTKGNDAIKIQAVNIEKICKNAIKENVSDEEKSKAAQMAEQMNKKFEELNDIDKLKSHAKRAGFGTRLYNGISNFAAAVSGVLVKVVTTLASPLVRLGMFASRAFAGNQNAPQVENNNRPGI